MPGGTGITSLADIRDRKYPLKGWTALRGRRHPSVWCAERVLEAYGFSLDDIESWGGEVLRDRPRYMNLPGYAPVSEGFDAVFDEAIMTRRWRTPTEEHDIRFLPIDDAVLTTLEHPGCVTRHLPKGRFRASIPTCQSSTGGWLLFCRQDMDEDLAYHIHAIRGEN